MYTKKLNTPKSWYKHNAKKYIISLNPGKPKSLSIPIGLLIKQIIKEPTTKIKKILRTELKINNKIIDTINYPVMLLDIVTYDNQNYRLCLQKGRYVLKPYNSSKLFLRVDKITKFSEDLYQLNLNNGFNILSKNKEMKFVSLDINNQQYQYDNLYVGDTVIITKGKYSGNILTCTNLQPLEFKNEELTINLKLNQIVKIEK